MISHSCCLVSYSVGCCVISCHFFVISELLLDFTYSGCKGLEKIGWHFFRTQYGYQIQDGRQVVKIGT